MLVSEVEPWMIQSQHDETFFLPFCVIFVVSKVEDSRLFTHPLAKTALSRSSREAVLPSQPRLSMLNYLQVPETVELNRRGLLPVMKNRTCEFTEAHLSDKISLDASSSMAGLSPHHLARAFQQSLGMPAHQYLLRRRLEHVEKMLRDTQLPQSQIAQVAEFSDRSRLARHFRRVTRMSSSLARGIRQSDQSTTSHLKQVPLNL